MIGNRLQSEILQQNSTPTNSLQAEYNRENSIKGEVMFHSYKNFIRDDLNYAANDKEVSGSRVEAVSSDPTHFGNFFPAYRLKLNKMDSSATLTDNKKFHSRCESKSQDRLHFKSNMSPQICVIDDQGFPTYTQEECENRQPQYVRKEDNSKRIYLINANEITSGSPIPMHQVDRMLSAKTLSSYTQMPINHSLEELNKDCVHINYNPKRQIYKNMQYRNDYDSDENDMDELIKVERVNPSSLNIDDSQSEYIPNKEHFSISPHDAYLAQPSTSYVKLRENGIKPRPSLCKDVGVPPNSDVLFYKKCELSEKVEHLKRIEQAVKQKEERAQESIWLALQEQQAVLREQQIALKKQQACLNEREQNLLKRELLAQKKFDQVNIILEETKKLKSHSYTTHNNDNFVRIRNNFQDEPFKSIAGRNVGDSLQQHISFDSQHTQLTSNVILQPGLIFPSHKVQEVIVNVNSKQQVKQVPDSDINEQGLPCRTRRGRKPHKVVLPEGLQEVLPTIKPSTIKRTYSRIPKRHLSIDANDCSTQIGHHSKISKPLIMQNIFTDKENQGIMNDVGTMTSAQLPKYEPETSARINFMSSEMKPENLDSALPQTTGYQQLRWSTVVDSCSPHSSDNDASVSFVDKVEKLTSLGSTKFKTIKEQQGNADHGNTFFNGNSKSNAVFNSIINPSAQLNNLTVSQHKNNLTMVTLEGVSLPSELPKPVQAKETCEESSRGSPLNKFAKVKSESKIYIEDNSLFVVPNSNKNSNRLRPNSECSCVTLPVEGNINFMTELQSLTYDFQSFENDQRKVLVYTPQDNITESFENSTDETCQLNSPINDIEKQYSPQLYATVDSKSMLLLGGNDSSLSEQNSHQFLQFNDNSCPENSSHIVDKSAPNYIPQNFTNTSKSSKPLGIDLYEEEDNIKTDDSVTLQERDTSTQRIIEANINYSSSDHGFSILDKSFDSFLPSEVSDKSPSKVQNSYVLKSAYPQLQNDATPNESMNLLDISEPTLHQKSINSVFEEINQFTSSDSTLHNQFLLPVEARNASSFQCMEQTSYCVSNVYPSKGHTDNSNFLSSNEEPKAILPLEIEINSEINTNLENNLCSNACENNITISGYIIKPSSDNEKVKNPSKGEPVESFEDLETDCSVESSNTNSPGELIHHNENYCNNVREPELDQVVNISNSSVICESDEVTSFLDSSTNNSNANETNLGDAETSSSLPGASKDLCPRTITETNGSCILETEGPNNCSNNQEINPTSEPAQKVYKKRGRKRKFKPVEDNIETTIPIVFKEYICGKCDTLFNSDYEFELHVCTEHNGLARIKGESQHFLLEDALEIISTAYRKLKSLSSDKNIRMTCEICKKVISSLHGFKYHYKNVCCGSVSSVAKPAQREAAKLCKNSIKNYNFDNDSLDDSNFDIDDFDSPIKNFFSCGSSPERMNLIQKFKDDLKERKEVKCINDNCNFQFSDYKSLKIHLVICPHSYNQYSCCLCTFSSATKSLIMSHIHTDHSKYLQEYEYVDSDDDDYDIKTDKGKHKKTLGNGSMKGRRGRKKTHYNDSKCHNNKIPHKHKLQNNILYNLSKALTADFRKKHYQSNLFASLICPKSSWQDSHCIDTALYLPSVFKSPKFKFCNSRSKWKSTEDCWHEINRFSSSNLKSGNIIFAGGPIQTAAWCPTPENLSTEQYLALTCQGNLSYKYPVNKSVKHEGLIQLWNIGILGNCIKPFLSFSIAHYFGLSWCLEWCPSGIFETKSQSEIYHKRLGLLGSSFSDGSIRIFVIPNPSEIDEQGSVYKRRPDLSLLPYQFEEANLQCTNMSWCLLNGHSLVAGSFSNGMVCVWDISLNITETIGMIKGYSERDNVILYPVNCIKAHHGVCSTVSFCPSTDGQHIVSGGSDRIIRFWDLTQPEQPLSVIRKGSVTQSAWLPHWAGAFIAFDDVFSLEKTNTSFRDNGFYGLTSRSILAANASVNDIAASDWFNAIAQVDEAGEVVVSFQHSLTCDTHNEKHMSKKRFPIFSIKLESIKTGKMLSLKREYNQNQINPPQKPSKTPAKEEIEIHTNIFNSYPMTYELASQEFGVVFDDEDLSSTPNMESILAKQYPNLMEPGPVTVYPLMGASCISWNNNLGTHSWIFVGTKSGFGRIINLSYIDQN